MGMSPELRVLEEQDAALVLKECVELALEEEKLQRLHDVSVRLGIEDWKDDLSAIISAARANDIEVERLKEFAERNAAELLARSEERRVGKEWVSTCRLRWEPS